MDPASSSSVSPPPGSTTSRHDVHAATPTTSTVEGRPKRTRVAPQKVEEDVFPAVPSPAGSSKRKQPMRGNWSSSHLMGNSKSKFATTDLTELLSTDRAWTILTSDERQELVDMLPKGTLTKSSPHPFRDLLKTNGAFRADIRFFQEDLAAGRYDLQWIREAQKAARRRTDGDFDGWKELNRESFWGQKQKLDWSAHAGASSEVDLPTLVRAGYLRVGDVISLRRGMRPPGAAPFVVEKEAKITIVGDDFSITVAFPPGQHKFSSPNTGEDIVLGNVLGPITLSNAILQEDGRIIGVRGANSWREFRCARDNQDMGSLWDVRELYHSRQP